MARHHDLKILPTYYDAVVQGDKTFEVRKDDRAYQAGDTVTLRRYEPSEPMKPGPRFAPLDPNAPCHPPLDFRIGFVLRGGEYGLEAGYVAFSLKPMED